jgi:hypothetical protein
MATYHITAKIKAAVSNVGMRISGTVVAVAGIRTLNMSLAPSASAAAAPFQVGVNIHEGGTSTAQNSTIANVMQNRNFRAARMDVFQVDHTMVRDQVTKIRANGGVVEGVALIAFQDDHTVYPDVSHSAIQAAAYSQTFLMVDELKDVIQDWELLNEITLRSECQAAVAANAGSSSASYAGFTAYSSIAAVCRGMSNAIHDIGSDGAGNSLRVILGTVGRDWGFLSYMETQSVTFELVGWHVYPANAEDSLLIDTWYGFGTSDAMTRLAAFTRPVTINEFHSSEIFTATYQNSIGDILTETGWDGITKHMKILYSQSTADIERIHFYELRDNIGQAPPLERFGLMFSLDNPKPSLYIATAFAGGNLTTAEQLEVTSRVALTDAEIEAMRQI